MMEKKKKMKKLLEAGLASIIGFGLGVVLVFLITGRLVEPVKTLLFPNYEIGSSLKSHSSVEQSLKSPEKGEFEVMITVHQ